MAEHYSKSKLKRKKSSVDGNCTKSTPKRDYSAPCSDNTAETNRSVVPAAAAAWWNRESLSAVESLWMLTLQSYLEKENWDLVPDLPNPSTVKPTALQLEEQRWCDLNEEVFPFPEPTLPYPKTLPSSDPVEPSSSQQDLSLQTNPVPDLPDRQQSPHSRQSQNGKTATTTTTHQSLTLKKQLFLHNCEEAGLSAGSSKLRREDGRKSGEQEEQQMTGVNKQLHTNKMKKSDSQVSLQKRGESGRKVVEYRAAKEVQACSRGDGEAASREGGGLQSCPMCLMVFPIGFTQMDCDGHLAQCLSDMNADMTW